MTIERITLVIDQLSVAKDDNGVSVVLLREFAKCDRFADELQAQTQAKVTIVEQYPQNVLPTEVILLYTCNDINQIDPTFLKKFAKQIIVMDSGGAEDFEVLFKYGLAGAVGFRLFRFWQRGIDAPVTPSLLGLTEVAREMDATFNHLRIGESDYCDIIVLSSSGLPNFLVRYLEVYCRALS